MEEVEEISRVFDGNNIIVVLRRICDKSGSSKYTNGITLTVLHDFIRINSMEELVLSLPTRQEAEAKIERLANLSRHIDGVMDCIMPTILSALFTNIINSLNNYKDLIEGICPCVEIYEYMELLYDVKQKLLHFYRNQPYRALELSNDLSEVLTPEICLTEPFLPYITRELATPQWMVPQTVRTLNEACRIYQTREFIKKEGMELFLLMACDERIPLILWKMIAHYAVDMDKIKFRLFKVVTEKMLQGSECVKVSHLDLTTRISNVIHIV